MEYGNSSLGREIEWRILCFEKGEEMEESTSLKSPLLSEERVRACPVLDTGVRSHSFSTVFKMSFSTLSKSVKLFILLRIIRLTKYVLLCICTVFCRI
jgi:hypothetical protein